MQRVSPTSMGVYELFVPEAKEGSLYKYLILAKDGTKHYKADPYGNYAQLRPETASIVTDINHFKWTDTAWMKKRSEMKQEEVLEQPMSIYEVHLGSWMRHPGREEEEAYYSYRELAKTLVKYVKEMGYTHVELMGVSEYPFDGSWGYQVTGYYAPTYEYADPRKGEHPDWGTKIFDYGKDDGQWVANQYGGNENLEAIEFFKHINTLITGRNPGAVMIAEESTAWPKITGKAEEGGLNFTFKWNMGWMHDFLSYMKLDPYFRKDNHNLMTFAMSYNQSEKYVLTLSHDEVVHLKCSLLNKMPGYEVDKFKNLMCAYAYMMGHSGKKLLFMGQEFAQAQEWSEARELDWYLLQNPEHKKIQEWMKALLHIYKKNKAMYELDHSLNGFEWINADDSYRSIFSFIRKSKDGKNHLLFVINMTPVPREDYRVGVPKMKTYKLILNSEAAEFNGTDVVERKDSYKAELSECDGREYSFAYPLVPYGVAVFKL